MKWYLSIFIFIFAILGIQIYQNVELVRDSYNIQGLQAEIKRIEKENKLLREKISHSLSLRNLEKYAREKLGLSDPREVRLLRKRLPSPEEEIPSEEGSQTWKWLREWLEHLRLFFKRAFLEMSFAI